MLWIEFYESSNCVLRKLHERIILKITVDKAALYYLFKDMIMGKQFNHRHHVAAHEYFIDLGPKFLKFQAQFVAFAK